MDDNMKWYIGHEWRSSDSKGLHKRVLDIEFPEMEKPARVGKVVIRVVEVNNLNSRPTVYLAPEKMGLDQELVMGAALTPVDFYVEEIVRQMIVGEKAKGSIKTKSGEEITFICSLQAILESKYLFALNVKEIYKLAVIYKENGVKMFKEYPLFAQKYFVLAAQFLISYKPFGNLTETTDGVNSEDMELLLRTIKTNLAACLLQENRYEDVIFQTNFVDDISDATEKSIYRRASAFYNIKEFESALKTIEKIPNYNEKKEFVKLYTKIMESRKVSQDHYKNIVQRMFN